MLFARYCAALGVLVALGVGCSASKGGDGFRSVDAGEEGGACVPLDYCTSGEVTFANIALNCDGVPDVTSIVITGPCTTVDAGAAFSALPAPNREAGLTLQTSGPGLCHVEMNFVNGFVYSTDVTFAVQTRPVPKGCAACPPFVGPTGLPSNPIYLTDPRATCSLPGSPTLPSDAGPADTRPADAAGDAHRDASIDGGCICPTGSDGGVCVCKSFSLPLCPPGAAASASCDYSGTCMGCSDGAGFTCACSDAGAPEPDGGGPQWVCIGTGEACTGGGP